MRAKKNVFGGGGRKVKGKEKTKKKCPSEYGKKGAQGGGVSTTGPKVFW